MKKVAVFMLWAVIVLQVLYLIGAIPVSLIALFGDEYLDAEGMEVFLPLGKFTVDALFVSASKIIGAIVLLAVLNAKKKNVIVEIIAIVLFSGIAAILLIPEEMLVSLLRENSRMYVGLYSNRLFQRFAEGYDYIAFLNAIPTALLPTAAAFGIAYKKSGVSDASAK